MGKHRPKALSMRAHWFDFVLVSIIVFLEFKGYLPHTPNSAIALFKKHAGRWTTETVVPENHSRAPKKILEPVERMSSTIKQIILNHTTSNKIAIFSKSYCPYCKKAKALFDQLNQPYSAIEMDQHQQGAEMQDELLVQTGQRSVPNIFIGGKHIGGCDKVHELHNEGKLKDLLK